MLEVCTETAVYRHCRPLVTKNARLRFSEVHHGLDRQHHAFAQFRTVTASPEIRNLRLFVQARPDSVTYEFANHAESGGFHVFLNRRAHVSYRIPYSCLVDSSIQRFFGYDQQLAQFRLDRLTHRNRDRGIAVISLEHDTAVD